MESHFRAYFQSQNSPRFCFQIPNSELEIREIPGPEKPIEDPLIKRPKFFIRLPCMRTQMGEKFCDVLLILLNKVGITFSSEDEILKCAIDGGRY